jgi:uncharacterized protein
MNVHPFLKSLPPFTRLIFLVLFVLISAVLTSFLSVSLAGIFFGAETVAKLTAPSDFSDLNYISLLRFMQIFSQLGIFILPVVAYYFFAGRDDSGLSGLSAGISWRKILAASLSVLVALPLISLLAEWNSMLELPAGFEKTEAWMRSSEKSAENLTLAFLSSSSAEVFVLNTLMIAILPAIGEEILFRGVLLKIFTQWLRNHHLSIFVTAFLFSAIHFQFYGFIPRFLMGLAFGYYVHRTSSLWVPVAAHFVNNFAAVVVAFLAATGIITTDIRTFGSTNSSILILCSVFLTAATLWYVLRSKKQPPVQAQ